MEFIIAQDLSHNNKQEFRNPLDPMAAPLQSLKDNPWDEFLAPGWNAENLDFPIENLDS
jgi:hypothetical protein